MNRVYSPALRDDLLKTVQSAIESNGILNISVVAEEIRKRNEAENIALEDVEQMVLEIATNLRAAVEFNGAETNANAYVI
jgi:hypothetical protein